MSIPGYRDTIVTLWHLDRFNTLIQSSWPRVDYPEDWASDFYNSHTPLKRDWFHDPPALYARIEIGELDLVRSKVEDWRVRYEEWVKMAGDRLSQLSPTDLHYDMVQAAHSRGLRILAHVDALLSK